MNEERNKRVYARTLSENMKAKTMPIIIDRDYNHEEQYCMFCGGKFLSGKAKYKKTWEHLDNDDENQQPWNLCLVHWICNQKKKYDFDLQFYANELIKINKQWHNRDSDSFMERTSSHANENTEIDLNTVHYEITENFLTEKITGSSRRLPLTDAISCIVLRCKNQTGHGSMQSVRNYLNVLSCSEGRYMIEKIEGKNFIQKRS